MIEVKDFIKQSKEERAITLELLSEEIKELELRTWAEKLLKIDYEKLVNDQILNIKLDISLEKDDKDKKKFSNELERETELKKRYDFIKYDGSIRAHDLKIFSLENDLRYLKRTYEICFELLK